MKSYSRATLMLMGILSWSCLLIGCDQSDKARAEPLKRDKAKVLVRATPNNREQAPSAYSRLVSAARSQVGKTTEYDPSYVRLDYPRGDLPIERGVCADVVVRAFRKAHGMDLQKLLHEDMKGAFSEYPRTWGLSKPDPNIDHRRVLNLKRYFERKGVSIAVTKRKGDYLPGDLVTCTVPPNLPHIMIVSDRSNRDGLPLVIHNIGRGTKEEDRLFEFPLTGHYRINIEDSNSRIDH